MKRYPAMALLGGLAVAIAGCGSGSGPSPAARPATLHVLQAAATSTTAAKSAHLSLAENVTVEGHHVALSGTGEEDFARHAFTLSMSVVGHTIVVKKVGDTLYAKMTAALGRHLGAGKPWLAIDLNRIAHQATGSSLSQLTQNSQSDTATLLSYLQSVSTDGLRRAGTARVRGVPTTEYDATVDLSAVADKQAGPARRAIQMLIKQMATSSYPMKVWVDHRGLVRQLQFVLSMEPTGVTTPVKVTATEQLYDFGAPVVVSAPPASRTTDLTRLAANALPSSGGVRSTESSRSPVLRQPESPRS